MVSVERGRVVNFPALGRFGRLGNQLFQLAATIGHAERHGAQTEFPLWESSHAFRVPEAWFTRSLEVRAEYWEPGYGYTEIPAPGETGQSLMGYFQSPRYFDRERTLALLTPRYEVPVDRELCGVHVRRGDYVRLQDHHPVPTVEWYRTAIERMVELGAERVRFYSDEPEWCEWRAREFCPVPFTVSRQTEVRDLAGMAACGFLVTANSSLSWWGAYLGDHRHVVCPARWFGPALEATHGTADLILPEWEAL